MKRILVLIIAIVLITLSLTSCERMLVSDEEIADATVEKVISAVKDDDASALISLFSSNIRQSTELRGSAEVLIDFIEGDIVSCTRAAEHGVGVDERRRDSKRVKQLNSSFTIETTEAVYHVGIYECVRDDYDDGNVGICSLSIIRDEDRNTDSYYRTDREAVGIIIDEGVGGK